eukprot:gene11816-8127_t
MTAAPAADALPLTRVRVAPTRTPQLLRAAGFSLHDEERKKYLKTTTAIGQGSFGKVGEAYRHPEERDAGDNSQRNGYVRVAIKEIDLMKLKDEAKRLRVVSGAIREARLLRRVRGAAHLIQSFRPWYNARRGRLCFPMEMADMDLDSYLRSWRYSPPLGFLLSIFLQVLRGLEALHAAQVVHRDIKSENFLVFACTLPPRASQAPVIKLADFGLSTAAVEARLHDDVGTPYFLAPECFAKSSAAAARDSSPADPLVYARDVWALGCVLFEVVHHGKLPFDGATLEELRQGVLAGRRHLPSSLRCATAEKEVLHQLALRCLEVDMTRRPTVSQLLQEMNEKVELLRLSPLNRELLLPLHLTVERERQNAPAERGPKLYQLMRLCRPGYTLKVHPTYPNPVSGEAVVPSCAAQLRCGEYVLAECEFDASVPSGSAGGDRSCPALTSLAAAVSPPGPLKAAAAGDMAAGRGNGAAAAGGSSDSSGGEAVEPVEAARPLPAAAGGESPTPSPRAITSATGGTPKAAACTCASVPADPDGSAGLCIPVPGGLNRPPLVTTTADA